jgi:hypothetical protein
VRVLNQFLFVSHCLQIYFAIDWSRCTPKRSYDLCHFVIVIICHFLIVLLLSVFSLSYGCWIWLAGFATTDGREFCGGHWAGPFERQHYFCLWTSATSRRLLPPFMHQTFMWTALKLALLHVCTPSYAVLTTDPFLNNTDVHFYGPLCFYLLFILVLYSLGFLTGSFSWMPYQITTSCSFHLEDWEVELELAEPLTVLLLQSLLCFVSDHLMARATSYIKTVVCILPAGLAYTHLEL